MVIGRRAEALFSEGYASFGEGSFSKRSGVLISSGKMPGKGRRNAHSPLSVDFVVFWRRCLSIWIRQTNQSCAYHGTGICTVILIDSRKYFQKTVGAIWEVNSRPNKKNRWLLLL